MYIALYTPQFPNDIPNRESVEFDNLIELEGLQFYGDFDNNADHESATNLESNSDAREISFDSDFVSAIIEEDPKMILLLLRSMSHHLHCICFNW